MPQPADVVSSVCTWFVTHGRDLPWRAPECTPWGVLVSEVMLQQTPVARVVGPWREWLRRWPTPAALASAPPADVITAWGRLGYPRRALRLREAATVIVERFGGAVPDDVETLRSLPGIGEYTAAAVASFAYGHRCLVLDTNVRRVLARLDGSPGVPAHLTAAERDRARRYLPEDPGLAATWAAASMEVGALLCRPERPRCGDCPVAEACRWHRLGHPGDVPRRRQAWEGTDRQCRGRILARLREAQGPVPRSEIIALSDDPAQAERCLTSLVADGLAVADSEVRLP